MNPPRDAGLGGVEEGEEFACLPKGVVEFSNCLGVPISGNEKKIRSLFRKLESNKGRWVKMLGGRRKFISFSQLDKEIQRLECSINYNGASSMVKGKRKGGGT